MRFASLKLILIFLTCLSSSCQEKAKVAVTAETYFPIRIGQKPFQMQLAITSAESQKGLMHRPELPAQHGMVFIFPEEDSRSFWMKNTQIPLDLIYFDGTGQWQEKHELYPFDESSVSSVSDKVQFAVELNQGEVSLHKLNSDTHLNLDDLKKAIQERGFSPQKLLRQNQ